MGTLIQGFVDAGMPHARATQLEKLIVTKNPTTGMLEVDGTPVSGDGNTNQPFFNVQEVRNVPF